MNIVWTLYYIVLIPHFKSSQIIMWYHPLPCWQKTSNTPPSCFIVESKVKTIL